MNVRDRVIGLRRVQAKDLRPNPKNWRTHPTAQRDALKGMLADVGISSAVLARALPDGSLMLIDGHLRTESLDQEIPVLVLDVTEAEADKLLATMDPLAALAGQDDTQLVQLLQNVSSDSAAVQKMLADLIDLPGVPREIPDGDKITAVERFEILISCTDETEQGKLLEQLLEQGVKCKALLG